MVGLQAHVAIQHLSAELVNGGRDRPAVAGLLQRGQLAVGPFRMRFLQRGFRKEQG